MKTENESWLTEHRTELELIILTAKLLGHVGIHGSGYARRAIIEAEEGDLEKAEGFRYDALRRWNKFVADGL